MNLQKSHNRPSKHNLATTSTQKSLYRLSKPKCRAFSTTPPPTILKATAFRPPWWRGANKKTTQTITESHPTPAITEKPSKTKTTKKTKAAAETTTTVDITTFSQSSTTTTLSDSTDPSAGTKTTIKRSNKVEIDLSVSNGHINTYTTEELTNLTRKITPKDDHTFTKKIFKKQVDLEHPSEDNNIVMLTWNIAGFRGAVKNGLWDKINSYQRKPDIICLQEMKIQPDALNKLKPVDYSEHMDRLGYKGVYNLGNKPGYSGVGVLYNENVIQPLSHRTDSSYAYQLHPSAQITTPNINESQSDLSSNTTKKKKTKKNASNSVDTTPLPHQLGLDEHLSHEIGQITGDKINDKMRHEVWKCLQEEGRIITVDCGSFYLITTYVPTSGGDFDRLLFRYSIYEPVILEYLLLLQKQKPILYNGDLNAASSINDVHLPSECSKSAGFQPEEIERVNRMVMNTGLVDAFRTFQGHDVHGYTYWGHQGLGRIKDLGWRIDYWMASDVLYQNIKGVAVTDEFKPFSVATSGRISDHAPLWISFDKKILSSPPVSDNNKH